MAQALFEQFELTPSAIRGGVRAKRNTALRTVRHQIAQSIAGVLPERVHGESDESVLQRVREAVSDGMSLAKALLSDYSKVEATCRHIMRVADTYQIVLLTVGLWLLGALVVSLKQGWESMWGLALLWMALPVTVLISVLLHRAFKLKSEFRGILERLEVD